jgi:hypothetical protein
VIENSAVTNLAGGVLIEAQGAVNVTVRRVRAFGGTGRFFVGENFKSVRIENCTIDRTSGIHLVHGVVGSSVVITKNRHRNVQDQPDGMGNFIQFAEVQNPTVEVSWNENVNDYNQSNPEDLISIYKSRNLNIHNNYFQGQYSPNNTSASSQNGITLEIGDGGLPTSGNVIRNNTLVSTMGGIGMFPGTSNNLAEGNRVVRSGFLPGTATRIAAGWSGNFIASGSTNNHQHNNFVGFVNRDGNRNDFDFAGAPEGDAAERATNTSLPNPVTLATEQTEWTLWQAKLGANGITLGA